MSYKINLDKDYRMTIPIELIRGINPKPEDYLKVTLRKDDNLEYFYLRIPTKQPSRKEVQVRRKLSERIIKALGLKQNDKLVIESITKLEIKKSDKPFANGKFDILSIHLDGLMADTFIRDNEEWCRFWSSSKFGGIAKEIELKRFIPIDREMGEFFGLMQAESRKFGEKFDFTNILVSEHKKFLEVSEILGVNKRLWKFGLIYNPYLTKELIENYIDIFSKELGIENGYVTKSNTITTVAYAIYIPSTILNEIMNLVLQILRKFIIVLAKNPKNKCALEFCKGFIIKYLLGDGTVNVRKDLTQMELVLSENDKDAQKDTMDMLNIFDIHSNTKGIKTDISTDFESCLWFLENDLFIGHKKNREKFLKYLAHNFYVKKRFERFSSFSGECTIKDFAQKNSLSYGTAEMYLYRNMKRGFLELFYKPKTETSYRLTNKGKEFLSVVTRKLAF